MKKYSFLCLLLLALCFSCGKSEEIDPEYDLAVTFNCPDTIPYTGGQYFINIVTQDSWSAMVFSGQSTEGLSLSEMQGQGNKTIVLKIASNPITNRRDLYVEVSSGAGKVQKKAVCQRNYIESQKDPDIVKGHMEVPRLKLDPDNIYIAHYLEFDNEEILNYCMEYACSKYHARWVAFSVYDKTCVNTVGRTDAWSVDPKVPLQWQTTQYDFNPKYTRGHIVASNDRRYSTMANAQTFFYSNMSPMLYNFNGGVWLDLELKVKVWSQAATVRDTLYVAKGGTIDKEDQILEVYKDKVTVPKYYWMAILALKNGQYRGIAFYMEHKEVPTPYNINKYAMSIDDLEKLTDIDFFPSLPGDVEAAVESTYSTSYWPGL